jgi:hypothetical protein
MDFENGFATYRRGFGSDMNSHRVIASQGSTYGFSF